MLIILPGTVAYFQQSDPDFDEHFYSKAYFIDVIRRRNIFHIICRVIFAKAFLIQMK